MTANPLTKPYYAVIFTSQRTDGDNGYDAMSNAMGKLAEAQPGFISVDSARSGTGITVSYWESLEAIQSWKNNVSHLVAQNRGREKWYASYSVRICKVEREYAFCASDQAAS